MKIIFGTMAMWMASAWVLVYGSTISWNNTGGGNWSKASNWKPTQVPGASDIAVITKNGIYTVTLDTNVTVSDFVLGATNNTQTFLVNGYNLSVSGQATINAGGEFDLSEGMLSGTFTVASNGILNLAGTSYSNTPAVILNAFTLTNWGTVTWSNLDLAGQAGPQIYNYGLWDAQTNNTFFGNYQSNGLTLFNNYGTFRKSGGSPAGSTSLDVSTIFNNYGTVDIENSGLTINAGSERGVFDVATNCSLYCSSSTNVSLVGAVTFSGGGVVNGGLFSSNAMVSGVLNVSRNLYLAGTMTIASNSLMNLSELGNAASPQVIFNRLLLVNWGSVIWSNLDLAGYSPGFLSTHIYNYGLWDAQGNNTFYGSYYTTNFSVFDNYGTFRKSGGTNDASTYFDGGIFFNNFGTVDVESGTLSISEGVGSGMFNIAGNCTLASLALSFKLTGNLTFSGAGLVTGSLADSNAVIHGTFNAGTLKLGGSLTIASNSVLNLTETVYSSTPQVNFISLMLTNYGTVIWSNTDLSDLGGPGAQIFNYGLWEARDDRTFHGYNIGSGPTTFNNFGTYRKSGSSLINATFLDGNVFFNNAGAMDIESGILVIPFGLDSGVCNVAANCFLDIGYNLNAFRLTGNPAFSGAGLIGGSLVGSNAVINGTFNVNAGLHVVFSGTLTIASNSVLNLTEPVYVSSPLIAFNALTLTNYGTVIWSNLDLTGQSGVQVYNYGLWDAQADNVLYGGSGTTIFNNHGTFRKSAGSALAATIFDTSTAFNNTGNVDIQTGLLDIGGALTLSGGTLSFRINNTSDYGSVFLGGNASLNGTVNVNLNGYAPVAGNVFNLINYRSETGSFSPVNLPSLATNLTWQTSYGATAFTLKVMAPSPQLLPNAIAFNQNTASFSFAWTAVQGQVYQVQYTTNLMSANWLNLGDPINGTNGMMTVSDTIGSDLQRLYRVVLQ